MQKPSNQFHTHTFYTYATTEEVVMSVAEKKMQKSPLPWLARHDILNWYGTVWQIFAFVAKHLKNGEKEKKKKTKNGLGMDQDELN